MRYALAPATSAITATGQIVPVGGLGWTPALFWTATLMEFEQAARGRSGGDDDRPSITQADARRIALQHGKKLKE